MEFESLKREVEQALGRLPLRSRASAVRPKLLLNSETPKRGRIAGGGASVEFENLNREVEAARSRVERLRSRATEEPPESLLTNALSELELHNEELMVMNEQLREQREMLNKFSTGGQALAFRQAFQNVPFPILITDRAGVIVSANHAAANLLGVEPRFGRKPLASFIPSTERRAFRSQLAGLQEHNEGVRGWALRLQSRGNGDPAQIHQVLAEVSIISSPEAAGPAYCWQLKEIKQEEYLQEQVERLQRQLEATQQARDIALEREIRVREELEKAQQRTEQKLAGLEELYERAQAQIEILETSRKGQQDAVANPAAEPLFALLGYCELLLEEWPKNDEQDITELTQGLRDSAREVVSAISAVVLQEPERTNPALPSETAEILQVRRELADIQDSLKEQRRANDQLVDRYRQLNTRLEQRNAHLHQASRDFEMISKHFEKIGMLLESSAAKLTQAVFAAQPDPSMTALCDSLTRTVSNFHRTATSVLEYARLFRSNPKPVKVNLSKLFSAAAESEQLNMESGRQVQVEIDPSAEVQADPEMMQTLVFHLVKNAFQYTSNQGIARIRVHCHAGKHECHWTIEDNGPGFSREKAHCLFKPLQRLHGNTGPGGLGMGLAICRKIVERHNGTITAESRSSGAAFSFKLPM